MKKITLLTVLIITFFIASSQNQNNQQIEQQIDELLRAFSGNNLGGVASVYKKGNIVFEKAYGLSDMSNLSKMDIRKRFNLVGLSKSFTSVAVLKLVEKGKISLNDDITSVFSDFPEYGKKVKIENLLSHTSGLKKYSTDDVKTPNDVLGFLKGEKSLQFEAGTKMEYSNSDYALLALIIEKVSGLSYSDFLVKNIFKKLKMENTFVSPGMRETNDVAVPYYLSNYRYHKNTNENFIYGEQGIYSNIGDLAKWDRALYTSKLLKCEYLSKMFQETKLADKEASTYYGFGWVLMERNEIPYYWHGGSAGGYTNLILHLPKNQLTVLILVNREDAKDLFKNALAIVKLFDSNINL